MITSKPLQKNPNLFVFLPIFYIVWSDALLTPEEISMLQHLIKNQPWLKEDEKMFLLDQVKPAHQPEAEDLKNWLNEIKKVLDPEVPEENQSLVDIGIRLAQLHNGATTVDGLKNALHSLYEIEDSLGLISKEAIFHFYPETRRTITQQQSTQQTFNPELLARLLDGPHEAQIKKVKTLLSDKEFAYFNSDNLAEYREKVLQWCRHLADQGFGSMAYPKE
jgi:acyl-CoA oxidase